MVDLEVS
jgi:hypothetical protein